MKKIFWVFLGISLFITTFASAQYIKSQKRNIEVQRTQKLRGCGDFSEPLKISTFSTNPPFGWSELKGAFFVSNGFGVDLIKQIADEEKIGVTFVGFQSDEDMRKAFEKGSVDIWVGSYYDPKIRGMGHSYITPAFIPNVITVVFLRNKVRTVKSFDDLKGLKGAVRQDEQFYPYIRLSLPTDLEIEEVFDSKEAFTKLITGEVDYLLSSPYSAEAEARRFKLNRHIELISTPLLGQELFMVYSKYSACPQYLEDFKKGLERKREDMNALKRALIGFIDTWGQRFRDEPSLIDQLKEEGVLPRDFVLDTRTPVTGTSQTQSLSVQQSNTDNPNETERKSGSTTEQKE